jgi:hypothetical protein
MFVRRLNLKKGDREYCYLKVVENVWRDGRSVQKTLVDFGSISAWPAGKLEELVGKLSNFLKMGLVALGDVRLRECRQLGPYLPLSRMWERLGLDEIIACALADRKVDSRVIFCAKAMTLTRLVNPSSKKSVWESMSRDICIPGVNGEALPLQSYYRTLEYLSEAKNTIEKMIHSRLKHLFNQDVSLVFYDLTSSYFEGRRCPMAKRGYSREHRPDLLQIEIGLLVDAEGVPIGHEVFDGNVKDVTTVLDTLTRLREEFGVARCVFVGDDGMASEANLAEVEKRGYEYITSLALGKSLVGKKLLEKCRSVQSWTRLAENLWLHRLGEQGRARYIGAYNPERAQTSWERRKRHIRDCIEYIGMLNAPPKLRSRKRTADDILSLAERYLRTKRCADYIRIRHGDSCPIDWNLDRDALRRVRRTDGMLILKTNSTTLTDAEVAHGYRTLWRVEDAFRHIKDGIGLRPIRHWNDARVLGHVFVCVLAYTLERLYDRALAKAGAQESARAAIEDLRSIIVATLDVEGRQLRRRSEITARQRQLLAAAGVGEVPELW